MSQQPNHDPDEMFQAGAFHPPSVETLNELIPAYEFIELIDRGGMGAVYKARQKALDRLVAVKLLPPAFRNRRAFAARFILEAKALARLNHPNIVAVFDSGEAEGGCMYYVMEYVSGTNLRCLMREGSLSSRRLLSIVTGVCDALQYAHEQGVVHRDVKPANVLIDKNGRVKVADFGLAKILGNQPVDGGLTRPSDAVGTPDYIAPEALKTDHEVDHRADIYSLGVMLYEMLTGAVPKGAWEAPSRTAGTDAALDEVVTRALQSNPAKRYQNVNDLSQVLQKLLKGTAEGVPGKGDADPEKKPLKRGRRAVIWSAVLALSLAASAGLFLWGNPSRWLTPPTHGVPEDSEKAGPAQPAWPAPKDPEPDNAPTPMQRQRALAAWVFDRGGMVNILHAVQTGRIMGETADYHHLEDLPQGEYAIWRISMADFPDFNDEDLAGLVRLCEAADTVSNLNFHGTSITAEGLAHLIRLAPTLTHLKLTETASFSPVSLPFLKTLYNLKFLYITTRETDPMELDVAADMQLVRNMQQLLPNCHIRIE